VLDHTLVDQPEQGLAHRRKAHPEGAGELGLMDARTAGELSFSEGGQDVLAHEVAEGAVFGRFRLLRAGDAGRPGGVDRAGAARPVGGARAGWHGIRLRLSTRLSKVAALSYARNAPVTSGGTIGGLD
jgi:hypothetical protein